MAPQVARLHFDIMTSRTAWGHGLATITLPSDHDAPGTDDGQVLDVWYPAPALGEPDGSEPPRELAAAAGTDEARGVRTAVVTTRIDLDARPKRAPNRTTLSPNKTARSPA